MDTTVLSRSGDRGYVMEDTAPPANVVKVEFKPERRGSFGFY